MEPKKHVREIPNSLQNGVLVLFAAFTLLPLFVSLTAYPWLRAAFGDDGTAYYYGNVGNYWSFFVYLLGFCLLGLAIGGAIYRYRGADLRLLRERSWLKSHFLAVCMALLLFWSFLSFLFAKDKRLGLFGDSFCHEGLILYVLYGAFFLTGSWLSERRIRAYLELLVAFCSFLGLLMVLQTKLPPTLFYIEERRSLMYHQYNHLGYFLALCAPLSMGLFLGEEKKSLLPGRLLELWLILNALVYNSTRGSFLAVAVVLLLLNLYVFRARAEKKSRILFLDVLFLGTLFFLNTGGILRQRLMLFLKDFQNLTEAQDKASAVDSLGTLRGALFKNGIRISLQKPIFGYGPANLMEPYRALNSHSSSPHCDLILLAASLGIPAMLLYLAGLIGHTLTFLRHIRRFSIWEATVFLGAAAYFLSSLLGVSMYYTAPYYFLLLGCSYGILKRKNAAPDFLEKFEK